MTKKLEEELNLPNLEELLPEEEPEKAPTAEEIKHEIAKYKSDLSMVERADAALPTVEGLEQLDREMDEYAESNGHFEDQLIGKNVEDRHAAPIFRRKMLTAALQAKEAKMTKKMKMIELQRR